ncbi:TnsA endonuclease N-terminal domain-containing protein [Acinetobacter seifertii]|uniref:TnsA endonuclease N-terminal domain-containing protein n=1 Tax=Acinetobacter seifertii TaxID=1530123 RepID=UPI00124E70A5|nr:TnsA endonuclease N-terminal domain-containing protein [Acinetobacter seifertii]
MYPFPQNRRSNLNQFIWEQIEKAFQAKPNLASTLHGQRKIYQGCFGRRTALFPSTKSGGAIPLESHLELAQALCLEQSPQVKSFRTQAIKIPLSSNRFSYPDFLVQNIDGSFEIHEVKPSIRALAQEEIQKFEQVSEILNQLGILFKLIDQFSLPTTKQLQNLLYLYQRGHKRIWTPLEIDLAMNKLERTSPHNIEAIYTSLQKLGLPCELGDYLLFHKKIILDTEGGI